MAKRFIQVFILLIFFGLPGLKLFACTPVSNDRRAADSVPKRFRSGRDTIPAKTNIDAEDSDFVIKHPSFKITLKKPALKPGEKFHSGRRAWMLSAVIPGGGQIYNQRYWKLPIVYGGFVGLGLVINFNQKQYDQSLQYYKIKLLSPNSPVLPAEYQQADVTQISSLVNYYRRNRDLAIIGTAALWVAGIVDAYVDSELKGFDVSNKLSMHVSPWIQPVSGATSSAFVFNAGSALKQNSFGLTLSLKFKD